MAPWVILLPNLTGNDWTGALPAVAAFAAAAVQYAVTRVGLDTSRSRERPSAAARVNRSRVLLVRTSVGEDS